MENICIHVKVIDARYMTLPHLTHLAFLSAFSTAELDPQPPSLPWEGCRPLVLPFCQQGPLWHQLSR